MMENSKELEFPEGQEGVRGNQGFPLDVVTAKIYYTDYVYYVF